MLHHYATRSQLLLDDRAEASSLTPKNASAAIITVGEKYLLQHRDPIPNIFYPDHWGLFGGALEDEESYDIALQREIKEELCIDVPISKLTRFMTMDFSLDFKKNTKFGRAFFNIEINQEEFSRTNLNEGSGMGLFTAKEIFDEINVTPYDEFALWWFIRRNFQ
jgi:8-oxo-dGTP pyrophosphatase MutT (NUDIX family)